VSTYTGVTNTYCQKQSGFLAHPVHIYLYNVSTRGLTGPTKELTGHILHCGTCLHPATGFPVFSFGRVICIGHVGSKAVDRPKNLCVMAGSLTPTSGTNTDLRSVSLVVVITDWSVRSRPSSRSLVCQA